MQYQENIHKDINFKLDYFYQTKKIPNIIFHGPPGCGKKTIVHNFINKIYNNDKHVINLHVMYVNCSTGAGKGIKFIREDFKFFTKFHINANNGVFFKSVVLINADKLTYDAQSALRRCIELFSHNTRFFIIANNKYNMLKPILSRLCEIYVPEPINNVNLYSHYIKNTFSDITATVATVATTADDEIIQYLKKLTENVNTISSMSEELYEKGYSGIDIVRIFNTHCAELFPFISIAKKYEFIICFNTVRKEYRNEKLYILFILNSIMHSTMSFKNINFM